MFPALLGYLPGILKKKGVYTKKLSSSLNHYCEKGYVLMTRGKGDQTFFLLEVLKNLSCSSRADLGLLFKILTSKTPTQSCRELNLSQWQHENNESLVFAENLCFEIKKRKKTKTKRYSSLYFINSYS